MLVITNPDDQYVIVSKDKGYEASIQFLKNKQINIIQKANLIQNNNVLEEFTKIFPNLINNKS